MCAKTFTINCAFRSPTLNWQSPGIHWQGNSVLIIRISAYKYTIKFTVLLKSCTSTFWKLANSRDRQSNIYGLVKLINGQSYSVLSWPIGPTMVGGSCWLLAHKEGRSTGLLAVHGFQPVRKCSSLWTNTIDSKLHTICGHLQAHLPGWRHIQNLCGKPVARATSTRSYVVH